MEIELKLRNQERTQKQWDRKNLLHRSSQSHYLAQFHIHRAEGVLEGVLVFHNAFASLSGYSESQA